MTIRFIKSWNGYYEGQIVTSPNGRSEADLVTLGYAVTDLDGPDNSPLPVTASKTLTGMLGLTAGETDIPVTSPVTFAQLMIAVAAGFVGLAFVTDVGGGSIWVSDGTKARPMNGEVVLYANPSQIALSNAQARAVGVSIPLPVGLWKDGDVIEVSCDISKSGAVDGSLAFFAIGPSIGTVGSQIGNGNLTMTSGNRRVMGTFRMLRNSSTSFTLLNGPNGQDGLAASSDLASSTTTVSADIDTGVRQFQLTNAMTIGGTDMLSVNKMIVKLVSC